MNRKLTVALAAAALAVIPATAAVADGHENAEVVVVHGVPGLEVDVLVDGAAAIEGFNFGDVVVTELPAGDYDLGVAAAGTTDAILSLSASLSGGSSVTVAAFLDEDGDPQLQAFANETSATGIQPFHLASFPAVDILSGDTAVLEGVTNAMTARIDVPGGATVDAVGIGAAGTGEAALELGDVTVPDDTLVLAFAIGPDEGEELPTVVVETVAVAGDAMTAPSAEHSPGEAGLASTALPTWALALMLIGALALAAPVVATARSRR